MNIFHHAIFPSIITEIDCPCFDLIQTSLIEWIYKYQKKDSGVTISNRGGWQSDSNFFKQDSFSKYLDYILTNAYSAVSFYNCELKLSNMWININKRGNYNETHNHPSSLISGVFWIKTSENCGKLQFLSPHSYTEWHLMYHASDAIKSQMNYDESFSFPKPKEGTMVLFPSHLLHLVGPNESDEDRISIAFNLNI